LQDEKGKIILDENLKYGTNVLDLYKYPSKEINLTIEAFGKKASYKFKAS
jgi:hypothetical protein